MGVLLLRERMRALQWVAFGDRGGRGRGADRGVRAAAVDRAGARVLVRDVWAAARSWRAPSRCRAWRSRPPSTFPLALGYLVFLQGQGTLAFGHSSLANTLLLAGCGIIDRRYRCWRSTRPRSGCRCRRSGCMQYLTPVLQFILGILVFDEQMPHRALDRVRHRVAGAGGVHRRRGPQHPSPAGRSRDLSRVRPVRVGDGVAQRRQGVRRRLRHRARHDTRQRRQHGAGVVGPRATARRARPSSPAMRRSSASASASSSSSVSGPASSSRSRASAGSVAGQGAAAPAASARPRAGRCPGVLPGLGRLATRCRAGRRRAGTRRRSARRTRVSTSTSLVGAPASIAPNRRRGRDQRAGLVGEHRQVVLDRVLALGRARPSRGSGPVTSRSKVRAWIRTASGPRSASDVGGAGEQEVAGEDRDGVVPAGVGATARRGAAAPRP